MNLLNKHKFTYINIMILLSFVILSILEIFSIWPHYILNGNDFYFHLERLEELVKSNEIFPRYALNSFADNGSAVMTMYPYLLLYPFAIIIKLLGHIHMVIYLMYIVNSLFTLIISYISSLKTSQSKFISYIFALTYSISFEYISLNFWSSDVGMSWSATFMPLIIFGFVYWLKYNRWLMLSIGISLIILSNVAISIIVIFILFIWTIFNYKVINKSHILSITKATILTIFTTALFWLPALKIILLNHHFSGTIVINSVASSVKPSALFATLIPILSFKWNGWFPWELTIPSLLGVVIGTCKFKKLNKELRQFYLISMFILLLCSSFFVWRFPGIDHVGGMIQTTIRMYLIPQVLFTYIFAVYIKRKFNEFSHNHIIKKTATVIICILLLQSVYISVFHNTQSRSAFHANGIVNTAFFNSKVNNPSKTKDYYVSNNHISNEITRGYGKCNNHRVHFMRNGNGKLEISLHGDTKYLSLPILDYHGTHYKCYVNGKSHRIRSKNNLVTLVNISKGYSKIHLIIIPDVLSELSIILFIFSIIIYLFIIFRCIFNKKKA